jgi:hypothetical protein
MPVFDTYTRVYGTHTHDTRRARPHQHHDLRKAHRHLAWGQGSRAHAHALGAIHTRMHTHTHVPNTLQPTRTDGHAPLLAARDALEHLVTDHGAEHVVDAEHARKDLRKQRDKQRERKGQGAGYECGLGERRRGGEALLAASWRVCRGCAAGGQRGRGPPPQPHCSPTNHPSTRPTNRPTNCTSTISSWPPGL